LLRLSGTVKKMSFIMAGAAVLMIIGGAAYHRSIEAALPFALGVVLTTAFNVVRIVWLEVAINKAVAMDEKSGANYIRVQYLLRFTALGLVLLVAVYVPFLDIFGAIFGIFTFHIAAFALGRITKEDELLAGGAADGGTGEEATGSGEAASDGGAASSEAASDGGAASSDAASEREATDISEG
jgi:predicted outer membrane lipoprotein